MGEVKGETSGEVGVSRPAHRRLKGLSEVGVGGGDSGSR